MCGIAGIMMQNGKSPSTKILQTLKNTLNHRGPDSSDYYINKNIGLVHSRLSIIDIKNGNQPLIDNKSGLVLIANGEIYNYVELKYNIKNYDFKTNSDCEPILPIYQKEGVNFSKFLRGMYAIAIYDHKKSRLILSRDPFGIKPLYFVKSNAYFAFASEPQSLLSANLAQRKINIDAREEILQLRYNTGRQTIFKEIQRVLPGETIIIENGKITKSTFLKSLPSNKPTKIKFKDAIKKFDTILTDSVKIHLRSDVPYGLFLSGGLDSATILLLMHRLVKHPISTFTIGFPSNNDYDERHQAHTLAKQLKTNHVEIDFSEEDFWELLPQVIKAVDDPILDQAMIPTYKMAKIASKELKVVLCGEGGDELFAGYRRYQKVSLPHWLGGRIIREKGIFDKKGILKTLNDNWKDNLKKILNQESLNSRTKLQISQAVDCSTWLPNNLLTKLDRCLMAHGLEGRTPFLDLNVSNFAFNLPNKFKTKLFYGKWILRKWIEKNLPEAKPFNKKKGFNVPITEWISKKGKVLSQLVTKQPGVEEIINTSKTNYLFKNINKDNSFIAWSLLVYALWHNYHVLGKNKKHGNVLDMLS